MLQQTQVAMVIPYYLRWMERFPNVEALALAEEDDVLQHWSGLGYYRRARLLHSGAKWVAEHGMPRTALQWRKVPGVGAYTAGAIASIAFQEPAALVDGNVDRFYARLEDVADASPQLHRWAWRWAEEVLVHEAPGDWNQALMELGATVCTPRSPSCLLCPVAAQCQALRAGTVEQRPVPAPRRAMEERCWQMQVCLQKGRLAMVQMPEGQWWHGLWTLPFKDDHDPDGEALGVIRHTVTHHALTIRLVHVRELEFDPEELHRLNWVTSEELQGLALTGVMKKAMRLSILRDFMNS